MNKCNWMINSVKLWSIWLLCVVLGFRRKQYIGCLETEDVRWCLDSGGFLVVAHLLTYWKSETSCLDPFLIYIPAALDSWACPYLRVGQGDRLSQLYMLYMHVGMCVLVSACERGHGCVVAGLCLCHMSVWLASSHCFFFLFAGSSHRFS